MTTKQVIQYPGLEHLVVLCRIGPNLARIHNREELLEQAQLYLTKDFSCPNASVVFESQPETNHLDDVPSAGTEDHRTVVIPIRSNQTVVGRISIFGPSAQQLSSMEREILNVFAAFIGIGLHNIMAIEPLSAAKADCASADANGLTDHSYRRLFETSSHGLLIVDASTWNILDVNPATTRLLGFTPDQFIGRRLWETPIFKNSLACDPVFESLQDKEVWNDDKLEIQTKSGDVQFFEVTAVSYRDSKDVFIQFSLRPRADSMVPDQGSLLVRENENRTQAESMNDAKDALLATVAHELRTPLAPIIGWARRLRTHSLDELTRLHALESIERNARLQVRIIDDLLDVSRIINGKLRLNQRPANLRDVIEGAIETLSAEAEAKEIKLHSHLVVDTGVTSVDPDRLQQALRNLISNALRFTDKGGRVFIALKRRASMMQITVNDTGIGIAADVLPFIFDRFTQAEHHRVKGYDGLGLGLAIVREIVELHGGTVHAESAGIGQGSTFTILLPIDENMATLP